MKSPRFLLSLLLLCGAPWFASADVLTLKDGHAVTGRYQGGDQTSIQFLVDGKVQRYWVSDVVGVTFAPIPAPEAAASAPSSSTAAPPSYSTGRGAPPASDEGRPTLRRTGPAAPAAGSATSSAPAPPPPPRPMNIAIPAGTEITIRMIDPVDSAVNRIGETFRASLDEPIVVDGRPIVPRGGDVTAKLTEVEQAGRISGRSELALVLLDITINGRKHEITTAEVSEQGASRGAQTARRVIVGSAIGTVIGAIAGGGKGAAQGAAAWAGAGAAVQVLTHGQEVRIPSESRLVFTLQNPLNI